MKKLFNFLLVCTLLVSAYSNGQTLTPSSYGKSKECQMMRADVNDFTPFFNTIAFNQGDTILELVTPPIGDQGSQGSCSAWAFGYGCASVQAYEVYQDWNWARRSPSFLFNQRTTDCSGAVSTDIIALLRDSGVCSFYLMPYDETDCTTQPSATQRNDALLNKSMPSALSTSSVLEYKQFLQIGHPIGVVTPYASDLKRVWNSSTLNGLWNTIVLTNTDSIHSMCVVGYDDHQQLFKVMNSWGTSQGDNGFVWVSYALVQNGIFSEAYAFDTRGNGFVPQIQGPTTQTDSAWYYVRNAPINGATITWSITNTGVTGTKKYHLVSPNGRDSMYIADRPIPLGPINPPVIGTSGNGAKPGGYHRGNITVTLNYGSNDVHTVTKTIREYIGFGSKDIPQEDNEGDYKMELWSTTYGLVRVQDVDSADERMDMNGLPQGVYVLIIKQNGIPVSRQKVMIP